MFHLRFGLSDHLGRFGRFTLFSPRVSHSKHLPVFCFVLCFGFGGVCCFVVFLFPVLQVFGIPYSPRSLDLDDRQGFIASSAMQQKKKGLSDHLKTLLDFVFGSRRRVKKVRIFRGWFSHGSGAVPALETFGRKPFSSLRSEKFALRRFVCA